MAVKIAPMSIRDYDEVVALWNAAGPGLHIGPGDSRKEILRFLRRNPGMSQVARDGRQLVGAILCGHDGRRGLMYHMAVAGSHRRMGLGKKLAGRCLKALGEKGIRKCYILVRAENKSGLDFWLSDGWRIYGDVALMGKDTKKSR